MVASCGGAQELGAQGDGLRSKAAVSYASVGPWGRVSAAGISSPELILKIVMRVMQFRDLQSAATSE